MSNNPQELEQILEGGWGQDTPPVRIGDTVRKASNEQSSFAHDVLKYLEQNDFDWSPKYLGTDEQGRDIYEYVDGYIPHGQPVPDKTWSIESNIEIFRHIRKLHDFTAGSALAGKEECIIHGDLSYYNTVYRDGQPVGFIDWDFARPGSRITDVASAIDQYLSLGEFITEEGPIERARLARILADTYGLTVEQRGALSQRMLDIIIENKEHQIAQAQLGKPSTIKFIETGVPERMQKQHDWLLQNRSYFDEAFQ